MEEKSDKDIVNDSKQVVRDNIMSITSNFFEEFDKDFEKDKILNTFNDQIKKPKTLEKKRVILSKKQIKVPDKKNKKITEKKESEIIYDKKNQKITEKNEEPEIIYDKNDEKIPEKKKEEKISEKKDQKSKPNTVKQIKSNGISKPDDKVFLKRKKTFNANNLEIIEKDTLFRNNVNVEDMINSETVSINNKVVIGYKYDEIKNKSLSEIIKKKPTNQSSLINNLVIGGKLAVLNETELKNVNFRWEC